MMYTLDRLEFIKQLVPAGMINDLDFRLFQVNESDYCLQACSMTHTLVWH